ncbi:L,D-transpeptidase family protein [Spirosoma spitsbergense]|uniref:L,D-transpeptidase family protein n=1 Tax=Spirosoma spitsbergense TaxID=431554 RepID=UPI00037FD1C5|nr:L,D-transpeptidase family protein [Spirosoma spitsbergense]
MRYRLVYSLLCLLSATAGAQPTTSWERLSNYAQSIGAVDASMSKVCPNPDAACLLRYFTAVVYGHTPRHMSYQGVPEQLDTTRINRLVHQFLAGAEWGSLLDSLESHDRNYRQLTAYCMRCLVDDYMSDSLTIEQVQETLNTYRWLNRFSADKRILINSPSATLRVVDRQGNTLLSSRIIVGKPDTPTPNFTAFVPSVVVYPYWNVPRSIMVRELLPKIRRNPAATLEAMNLQVIDAKGQVVAPARVNWSAPISSFPYRLRQSTGCDNALGLLKFNVTSPYDIYLHDTNARPLFARENRFLSHGCIRVEKPAELANLLLGQTRFATDYLTNCPINGSPKTVALPNRIPILITYSVLDIDDAGAIQVYRDIYSRWHPGL